MAWPPPVLPINITNATEQNVTHPDLHNNTSQAVNDIVAKVTANEGSTSSAFAQLRTGSFAFQSVAGPAGGSQFAGGATFTPSGMFVQFTMPVWSNKIMVIWGLGGHSGKGFANATFDLSLQMTPGGGLTPPSRYTSANIDWRLQGTTVGAGLFAATENTVVRFDLGGVLVSGPGGATFVDAGARLFVAAFFQSAT